VRTKIFGRWLGGGRLPLTVMAIAFLEQAAFVVLFLFLTQRYLAEDRGLGVAFAGYAITVFGLTKLTAQTPAGWLGDRIGYRTLLVLGFATSVIAATMLMHAQPPAVILVAVALYAVGKAMIGPAMSATVANLYDEANRGQVVAYMNLANLGAYLVAGLGGFMVIDLAPAQGVFLLAVALNAAPLLVAMFWLEETAFAVAAPAATWRWRALPFAELASPHVLTWGAIVLLLGLGMGLVAPLARPYARDVLDMEIRELAPYLVLPAVLAAVCIIPCGRLADRWGRVTPAVAGLALGSAGLLGVALTADAWGIMVMVSLIMLSYTLLSPAVGAAMMDVAREETRGFVLGALATVQGLGGAVGPAIGGRIYEALSPQDVFVVAASLLGGAMLLTIAYAGRRQLAYAFSPVPADD